MYMDYNRDGVGIYGIKNDTFVCCICVNGRGCLPAGQDCPVVQQVYGP